MDAAVATESASAVAYLAAGSLGAKRAIAPAIKLAVEDPVLTDEEAKILAAPVATMSGHRSDEWRDPDRRSDLPRLQCRPIASIGQRAGSAAPAPLVERWRETCFPEDKSTS